MTVSARRDAGRRIFWRIRSRPSGRRYIDRRQVPAAVLAITRAFAEDLCDRPLGIAVRAKSNHQLDSTEMEIVYLPKFEASIRRLREHFADV
jgi:hypothetical protein